MAATLRATPHTTVARPLKVLVPLIQEALHQGDAAGLAYYREAGEMLLEAREQVPGRGWTSWLSKNFALSRVTAWRYMKLAEKPIRFGHETDNVTLQSAIGERPSDHARRVGAWQPIRDFTARVPADRFGQERQAIQDEVALHRQVAIQLIDIGYRALATRLHPDRGGSKEAMSRLNRVRDELKAVAETRRFV